MEKRHGSNTSSSEERREAIKGTRDIGGNPDKRDYSEKAETPDYSGIRFLEDVRTARVHGEHGKIASLPLETLNPQIDDSRKYLPKDEHHTDDKNILKRSLKKLGRMVLPSGNQFSVFGDTKKPF